MCNTLIASINYVWNDSEIVGIMVSYYYF